MARPVKSDTERRSYRIDIRLTPVEHKLLNQIAAADGLSMSDYVRATVLHAKPVGFRTDPHRKLIIQELGQLGKIGSNLNQIAHELHVERLAGRGGQVSTERIRTALNDLKAISDHLLNILGRDHTQ